MSIFTKKIALLSKVQQLDIMPKLFVYYLDINGYHKFTYYYTHEDLFQKINRLKYNGEYYVNEMILDGQKRKPYLDMEKIFADKKTFEINSEEIIHKLLSDIVMIFDTVYGEKITKQDILLLDSSGQVNINGTMHYKISYHIIVDPFDRSLYYISSKFGSSSAYHLFECLINLDESYKDFLDPQVYNTDVNFRIIGSYKKMGDDRQLKPVDPITLRNIQIDTVDKVNYFITYIKENNKQLVTPLVQKDTLIKSNKIPFISMELLFRTRQQISIDI